MSYQIDENLGVRCLECGTDIPYGRPDRKFCSTGCKNRWHNRDTQRSRNTRLKTITALDRNYAVLDRLLKTGLHSLRRTDAAQMGFQTAFMTSHQKVKGHDEYRCYDIKYNLSAARIFAIERWEPPTPPEQFFSSGL